MLRSRFDVALRRVGQLVGSTVLAASVLSGLTQTAEARRRSYAPYSPPYASIVIDVKTGKVLQATNPDAPRHPASVTKVMTLYMLFEQLEKGRLRLDSELKMTVHASRMAPSKLGLQPGETITVEEAIKAVVTKSANDVAAAIADNVGGSEERFAELMTEKARSIGMASTTFVNASGLPDPEQITTARDLATLGRAIQDRFPKYYPYFGTRVFNYDGRAHRNHNHLLGRVEGVDGIKTGYTRASGFNLLTSAKTEGRHVITVVLGGKSARVRDAQVASLIEEHMPRAYAGARQTPRLVEVASNDASEEKASVRAPVVVAAAAPVPQERPRAVISAGQPVTAGLVSEARPRPAVIAELPPQRPQLTVEPSPRVGQPMALVANGGSTNARPGSAPLALAAATTPGSPAMRWNIGPGTTKKAEGRLVPPGSVRYTNSVDGTVEEAELDQPLPQKVADATPAVAAPMTAPVAAIEAPKAVQKVQPVVAQPVRVSISPSAEAAKARSGWVIQLGATDDEGKARSILDRAKTSNPKILSDASAFTEKVSKGDATLFRARFAGFESKDAEAACKALKRAGFSCFAQKI